MKRANVIFLALLGNLAFVGAAEAHHGWYDLRSPTRPYAEFESALSGCSRQYGDDPANPGLRKCMRGFGWRWEET